MAAAAAPTGPTPGDARVVYFGKIGRDATPEAVTAFAARAGPIAETAVRRGYAYVQYATDAAAAAALSLNGQTLGDRAIVVELSKVPAERPPRVKRERKPRAEGAAAAVPAAERKTYPNRVVVRGLPESFTEEALTTSFSTIGKVVKASIRRRLGRVTFETPADADRAMALSGTPFGDSKIEVEKEFKKERRPRKAKTAPAGGAGAPATGGGSAAAPKARAAAPKKATAAAAAPAAPRLPRRVRVDGIPAGTTKEQLTAHFAAVGPVAQAKVIKDRGHGFVTFENPADAEKAVSSTGATFNGAAVSVALDVRRPRATAASGGAAPAARPALEPRDVTNTLYLGNLDQNKATVETITAVASAYGAVASVDMIARNRAAYVKFAVGAAVAAAAAGLDGQTPANGIAFRPLRAEAATGPRPGGPRRGGRGPRRGAAPAS